MLKNISHMGLFTKNKKEASSYPTGLPELPKLPDLPKLPSGMDSHTAPKPNALPRFPSNSLGDKFSQSTIKDAISGEKEDDVVNEFEDEIQMMPKLPANRASPANLPKKIAPAFEEKAMPPRYKNSSMADEEMPEEPEQEMNMPSFTRNYQQKSQGNEPVFIRLDRFEESMDIFEKIKKQISGVDKLLNEIKSIKEREDKELGDWQEKMEMMKSQIEKIDKDIFSKIE